MYVLLVYYFFFSFGAQGVKHPDARQNKKTGARGVSICRIWFLLLILDWVSFLAFIADSRAVLGRTLAE